MMDSQNVVTFVRTRSSLDIAIYAIVTLVVHYTVTAIYSVYFHPLSKFPGPKTSAFSRLPIIWTAITGTTWKYNEDLHKRYGPVVRVAPDELTTISPTAWKDLYMGRPELPKDPYAQTPPLNGADSLFTATGHTHVRMRRTLIHAFSDKALREQSPIIESYVDLLMTRLRRERAKSAGKGVDMAKYYGYAALDIISDLTYGESFHSLEDDNENSWVIGFFLGAKFGSIRNTLSRFYPLDRIYGAVFLRLTAKIRARNWQFTTDRLTKRLEMGDLGAKRSDFITPVVGNVNEEKQTGITRKELNTNALAVTIAGCQLPTIALSTATYCLLRWPETLAELKKEIRSSFTSERDITVTSTHGLPYLTAVVEETLRMQHPTPITLPRVIKPEGQIIDGNFMPGGSIVGINLQTIQNSPANWFEPRVFHPERFLPPHDARYSNRFRGDNKEAFKPFAVGSRNCIGGKVFLAEAKVILAKMMWNFDLELVNPDEWDWMNQKAYLVFEPKSLMVRLIEKE